MLARINIHPRDGNIIFKEEGHEYFIKDCSSPISVTTLVHKFFDDFNADKIISKMMNSKNWPKSKYYGMTAEQIKDKWEKDRNEAATAGTLMHADIERILNQEQILNHNKEIDFFYAFWKDFTSQNPNFYPYRTEWLVYDESIGLAGSIDFVMSDDNNNLIIIDWKRSKEIKKSNFFQKGKGPFTKLDDCNFVHYSLQLNFYRHMLETKYQKNVVGMMLVVLHPNQDNYQYHVVNRIELSRIWNILTR